MCVLYRSEGIRSLLPSTTNFKGCFAPGEVWIRCKHIVAYVENEKR